MAERTQILLIKSKGLVNCCHPLSELNCNCGGLRSRQLLTLDVGLADHAGVVAERAGIGIVTVHQFEAGAGQPRRATGEVIKRAFEEAGVALMKL